MNSLYKLSFLTILLLLVFIKTTSAQDRVNADSTTKYRIAAAGPQYKRSGWHQFFWGKNYRKEWAAPVKLPLLFLDNEKGGLIATKEGGGHQTTALHLETKDGKNYSIRSVDKRLGKVLPKEFLGTFIEDLANDEVSMSNPYGAATVPIMAEAAGIYHTNPQYIYLPEQPALDSFNKKYANNVYLFEQRVKDDWADADNLGNFDKYLDFQELIKELFSETENQVDQPAYLKARLFDIFLNDWDRHEDQWSWGIRKEDHKKIFVPVPVDRDQAYFKHNGVLLDLAIAASGLSYFQSFKPKVGNIKTFNYEERGTDRLFTNRLNFDDWQRVAKELQASLTDDIIEQAIKQFPPEVYAISGARITSALKSRREQILDYATTYYYFLAKEVEIVGTKGAEYFEVNPVNKDEVSVQLFNKTKEGKKKSEPFYSRTFYNKETKEIRLYGLDGKDVYTIGGNENNDMRVRVIGGPDPDSVTTLNGSMKTFVYDDKDNNIFQTAGKTKFHLSNDTSKHSYVYRNYLYDKRGIKPTFLYSDQDRFFVGLGYGWEHHKWKKLPFTFKQYLGVNYSINQQAFSATYKGLFPKAIGNFDLSLLANYDFVRWTNFYGLGNETLFTTDDKDYNRMRTKEAIGSIGLGRRFGKSHISLAAFYQSIEIINDEERYVAKILAPLLPDVFETKNFAGAVFNYSFSQLNDRAVPTSGIALSGNLSYTQNVNETDLSFWKYGGKLQLYIPLISKFSIATSAGVSSVSGDPEFYQYPSIGGGMDLRGFQRQRFYGKTAFYNSNELRFISNFRSYLVNGKVGLLAFVDEGRVWIPQQKSSTWHVGYGGGVLFAPFNKILVDVTYGISDEDKLIQLRLNLNL
ncbi:MAG: BamA/TamA family outer membrane protein [Ginsengibacter sp.]